jgi:hypothetical protein
MARSSRRNRQLSDRVAMTATVGCVAAVSVILVSGALRAIEHIGRVENALADLSHYVTESHAAIRGRLAGAGSPHDNPLARFGAGVERRLNGLRGLDTQLEQQTRAYWWTEPVRKGVDISRFEQDGLAYVAAATDMATTPSSDPAMDLRLLDLHALQMLQTVEGMRDNVDAARERALADAYGLVALSMGVGALLIAYLIWYPVFGPRGRSLGANARRLPIGGFQIRFARPARTRWTTVDAVVPGGR